MVIYQYLRRFKIFLIGKVNHVSFASDILTEMNAIEKICLLSLNPFLPNWHFCRFYSVKRQMISLVNGELLRHERVKEVSDNNKLIID